MLNAKFALIFLASFLTTYYTYYLLTFYEMSWAKLSPLPAYIKQKSLGSFGCPDKNDMTKRTVEHFHIYIPEN